METLETLSILFSIPKCGPQADIGGGPDGLGRFWLGCRRYDSHVSNARHEAPNFRDAPGGVRLF